MKLTDGQRKVIEYLNWNITEDKDGELMMLENWSDAGEDLPIEWNDDETDIAKILRDKADGFDVDDNVELWADHRGENGVPNTIRELVEDAESIKKMYEELAYAVKNAELISYFSNYMSLDDAMSFSHDEAFAKLKKYYDTYKEFPEVTIYSDVKAFVREKCDVLNKNPNDEAENDGYILHDVTDADGNVLKLLCIAFKD